MGLGANISSDGTYPQTNFDANGNLSENRLNGSNDYRLSFEKTSLPPVDAPGSWSITIYDDNNNIVSDSSNSYYINSDRKKEVPQSAMSTPWVPINSPIWPTQTANHSA